MEFRTRFGLLVPWPRSCRRPAFSQAKPAAPAGVTPAAIAEGDSIFHKTGLCYACHGANAEGTVGPNLTDASGFTATARTTSSSPP